jgi:hypothetical protein
MFSVVVDGQQMAKPIASILTSLSQVCEPAIFGASEPDVYRM